MRGGDAMELPFLRGSLERKNNDLKAKFSGKTNKNGNEG